MNGKRIINQASLQTIIMQVVRQFASMPYIKTGVSNHHIHLSKADLAELFGDGYELTQIKPLQPGQYASKETVKITGPKGSLNPIRILGPVRGETQLELAMTDTFPLGIKCPVNESGNLNGAATVTIENPLNGKKIERTCAIIAQRHIHLTPETAERFDFKDGQMVKLYYEDGSRDITFGKVKLRVSPKFADEIHIDTDEANAGNVHNGDWGLIIP
jgi:putative phosphotransacetylase